MESSENPYRDIQERNAIPLLQDGDIHSAITNPNDACVMFLEINELIERCAASEILNVSIVMERFARRISFLIPDSIKAYRLFRSGFVFVIPGLGLDVSPEEFAEKVAEELQSEIDIKGERISVTVNLGLACGDSECNSVDDLIDRAQYALTCTSDHSDRSFEKFDAGQAKESRDQATLTQDLYNALDENEFTLYYQPIVSLDDYSLLGAEALIRWEHPERGMVSPGEFIPIAEKTGQIIFIDRWVLERAVEQAMEWYRDLEREIPIGVNISAWQFRDRYLVEKIESILDKVGLPPRLLKIEITETSMMKDSEHTARMINELKDLGIRIALDDFGTGHATFEYLAEFSIDELKLDRSFLDFNDVYRKNQTLVDLMLQTAQRVDLDVLAEGVEDPVQNQFLKNRGCRKAQGFLFSKPIPAPSFTNSLKENNLSLQPQTDSGVQTKRGESE